MASSDAFADHQNMAHVRRRELKVIAGAIAHSFISRNNDVDGWWALGLLCRLAQDRHTANVTIDLVGPESIAPTHPVIESIRSHYGNVFRDMLAQRELPDELVSLARISIEFGASGYYRTPVYGRGEPFLCTVSITDDREQDRKVTVLGKCNPHDPMREHRSNRWLGPQ